MQPDQSSLDVLSIVRDLRYFFQADSKDSNQTV